MTTTEDSALYKWALAKMKEYVTKINDTNSDSRIFFKDEELKTQLLAKMQLLEDILDMSKEGRFDL